MVYLVVALMQWHHTIKHAQRLIFLWGLSGFLFFLPHSAKALGVSPSSVVVDDILSGSTIRKEFYIVRGNVAQDEIGEVKLFGPAVNYIRFVNGTRFPLPKGAHIVAVPFLITPTLPKGSYEVPFQISTSVAQGLDLTEGASSGVAIGINATIRFSVTNEIQEQYSIQTADIGESEEGQPLGFTYIFINAGNVDARPTKIEFSLTDVYDPTHTYVDIIEKDRLPFLPAFSRNPASILTKVHAAIGIYTAKIVIYKGEERIFDPLPSTVQIWPKGTLAQKGNFESFDTDKIQYKAGESVKFTGAFENQGKVGLQGAFVLEIFRGELRLDVIKSDVAYLPIGQTAALEHFFRPPQDGKYRVVAYVTYGPFKSKERTATFRVGDLNLLIVLAVIATLTIALAFFLWWLHQRKKRALNK